MTFLNDYTQTYTYDEETKRLASIKTSYYEATDPIWSYPKHDVLKRHTGTKITVGETPVLEDTILTNLTKWKLPRISICMTATDS